MEITTELIEKLCYDPLKIFCGKVRKVSEITKFKGGPIEIHPQGA